MKTFEEILKEKMTETVAVKGTTERVLPMEAMVMSVMNAAMKGDIGAILFIRSLTEQRESGNAEEQKKVLADTIQELRDALPLNGIKPPRCNDLELEFLARNLITLRRVADSMTAKGHKDIQVTPQRDGSEKQELSTTNRIYNDLYKQWKSDWRDYLKAFTLLEIRNRTR